MAFDLGKFQTAEQRRNAQQLAQEGMSGMQSSTLRGPQNTSELGMPKDVGSKAMQTAITRSAMGIEQGLSKPQDKGQAVFDKQFGAFQKEQQLKRMMERLDVPYTPLQTPVAQVTPAERARDSEAQRMAQQYGGNEMRLALMDQAPTDQRLVDYYGAQARSAQALGDQMGEYFANTPRFKGDRKLADKFVQQHAGVAFREYIKENPQAVVGEGQKAAFSPIQPDAIQDTMDDYGLSRKQAIQQIQQGGPQETEVAEPEGGQIRNTSDPSGIDPSVNLDQPRTNREMTQQLAYKGSVPYDIAHAAQTMKTEVPNNAGQPLSINAEKPVMAASPFTKANKQAFDLLGIETNFGEDMLGPAHTDQLLKQLDSIKRSGSFLVD